MSEYFVYAIGAALVDTEIDVSDNDLDQLSIEKGMMTLVDEARQAEIIACRVIRIITCLDCNQAQKMTFR